MGVEFLNPILVQLSIGGIGGFLVGYSLKKMAKFLALVFGGVFILLQYLAWQGIIEINYGALFDFLQRGICLFDPSGLISFTLANVPFAGSFAAGFTLGVKAG